jgi:hypothetical protein
MGATTALTKSRDKENMKRINHYNYLERCLPAFLDKHVKGGFQCYCGIIGAHGDKGYGYQYEWEKAGIPFEKGMMLYLLSYCYPFSEQVRKTPTGFKKPSEWVVENYAKFKDELPDATDADISIFDKGD